MEYYDKKLNTWGFEILKMVTLALDESICTRPVLKLSIFALIALAKPFVS